MNSWLWPAAILCGSLLQALSLLPALRRGRLRAWLVSLGGLLVLLAAEREQDHLTLVVQLTAWVWLWRGFIRSRL